jgi:hypothetical protein
VYDIIHIEVEVQNTMRKQAVTGIIKVGIYRDVRYGLDVRIKEESRVLKVQPLSTGRVFPTCIPTHDASYYYRVLIEGKQVYSQPKRSPPRLRASKSETVLVLNGPSSGISAGSTIAVAGKLVTAGSGIGVNGAKICIYDGDINRNKIFASGTTGNDGTFCIEWVADKTDKLYNNVLAHVRFEGDDFYKPSIDAAFALNVSHMPQNLVASITGLTGPNNLGTMVQGQPIHNEGRPKGTRP